MAGYYPLGMAGNMVSENSVAKFQIQFHKKNKTYILGTRSKRIFSKAGSSAISATAVGYDVS